MLTGDQLALYEKTMYDVARETYKEKEMVGPKIFKMVKGVTGGGDKTTQILGAGRLDEHTAEHQDINFESPAQGWAALVKYRTFSKGVGFSKNSVEDNVKNGMLGKTLKGYAATWGSAIRNEKEIWGADYFNEGGYTSGKSRYNESWGNETDAGGNLLYDSLPLWNLTGNPRTTKGGTTTYYNAIATGTLSPTTFETLYILVSKTNHYSEMDRIIDNKPDTLLTEDGADAIMATRILNTDRLPGGQLNDTNPYQGMLKNKLAWAYLNDSAFYIGKAKHDFLQWHDRQAPVMEFYRVQDNRGYRATVDVRWGILAKPGVWRIWGRTAGTYTA